MKNTAPFAALTAAFTVAGSVIGYGLHGLPEAASCVTLIIAAIGGFAALFSQVKD